MPDLQFRYIDSLRDVAPADWDQLTPAHGFSRHAWLSAMEEGGMLGADRGLNLRCPTLFDGSRLVAAAPGFVKSNTIGECGPENLWLDVAEKNGRPLLPKVQLELPADASAGPRFLVDPAYPRGDLVKLLLDGLVRTSANAGFRAVTVARMSPEDAEILTAANWVMSQEVACVWENEGYGNLSDFLGRLKKAYRYQILKDRAEYRATGLETRVLRGAEIRPEHWDAFYEGHVKLCQKYGSSVRLTRSYLDYLGYFGDSLLLMGAFSADRLVAGVYCLCDNDSLFSRHWSFLNEVPGGVFELGLYLPMELAIAEGLRYVDSGIWGAHKVKRGFRTALWPSAHWFDNASMRQLAETMSARHRAMYESAQTASWEAHYFRQPKVTRGHDWSVS